MINEQHLEPHVLPPFNTDLSFRSRHFVSSVINEFFCVVHYSVPQPELSHAYSCSLSLVPCFYSVWVSVSICIRLTYQDSNPVKSMPREWVDSNLGPLQRQTSQYRTTWQPKEEGLQCSSGSLDAWEALVAGKWSLFCCACSVMTMAW